MYIRLTECVFNYFVNMYQTKQKYVINPICYGGGGLRGPPSGIGDCSKTNGGIDLKIRTNLICLKFFLVAHLQVQKGIRLLLKLLLQLLFCLRHPKRAGTENKLINYDFDQKRWEEPAPGIFIQIAKILSGENGRPLIILLPVDRLNVD